MVLPATSFFPSARGFSLVLGHFCFRLYELGYILAVMYVPLIEKTVKVVIHRLDRSATWAVDPPGADYSAGYDPILREPVISRVAGVRTIPRVELAEVKISCQVETQRMEQLRFTFGGDAPVTDIAFVLDRRTLRRMSLLDAATGKCLLQRGDRISRLEKRSGSVILPYQASPYTEVRDDSLFIYEVRPRSWGFGRDGYNLEIIYTYKRQPATM